MPRKGWSGAADVFETIARLRDLDIRDFGPLHYAFGRRPPAAPPHVSGFGLSPSGRSSRRSGCRKPTALDGAGSAEDAGKRAMDLNRLTADLSPGTMLAREWDGRMQRVAVLADGFAWNGKTYPSLSKIAFAITGTRWNGPRFFGLRDKSSREA